MVEDHQAHQRVDHIGFGHRVDILLVEEGPLDLLGHLDHQVGDMEGILQDLQEDQSSLLVHPGSHMEGSLLALEGHVLEGHHVQEDHHGLEGHHDLEDHRNPQDLLGDHHNLQVLKEDHQMGILKGVLRRGSPVLSRVGSQGSSAGLRMVGSCMDQKVVHHGESEKVGCEERECLRGGNVVRGHQLVWAGEMEQEMGCLVEPVCWFLMLEGLLSLV